MPLIPGQRLGPYEVLAAIGAGGMGEVYRAHDTKLGRDVALKILPPLFVHDPERVARFQREAQVLASLSHPNIAIIHGVEEAPAAGPGQPAVRALVMELVEGPTLADRIADAPIPIDEALTLARQIADALDAAHGQGVVHRDLKPANIKLRPDGTIKVLDFGLAKAGTQDGGPTSGDLVNSPTLTARATQMGMIIGTAAYMSPEQARGKAVDKRADIWAFGCVLFEMLTGRRLFMGDDLTETLASVVKEQPDFAQAPPRVLRLLRKCLEKDPRRRLRDIGDAWELLESEGGSKDPASIVPPATTDPPASRRLLPWAVAALAVAAATVLAVRQSGQTSPAPPPVRFQVEWPTTPGANPLGGAHFFQMSPDGRAVAIVNENALWVRPLDALEAVKIDRTQGVTYPFWSPDNQWIGFFQAGQLKVVSRAGGSIRTVCDAPDGRGATWSPRGVIVFSREFGNTGLFSVPEQGGTPSSVTKVAASGPTDDAHRYPQFLPDGERFLFLHLTGKADVAGTYVGSLSGSAQVRVLEGSQNALFAASAGAVSGHLLFKRDDALMAQAFDVASLKAGGTPFVVATGIGDGENTGLGAFSIGAAGTLVYGNTREVAGDLVRVDRTGARQSVVATNARFDNFALSADGRRIALSMSPENRNSESDIWLLTIGGSPSKFTFGPAPGWMFPVWSPRADHVAYATIDLAGQAAYEIRRKASNMAGVEEKLLSSPETLFLWDWSPDGKFLVYSSGGDLYQLRLDGDRKPVAFTKGPAEDHYGQVSPDGRWMVYTSGDRNQSEVYVQPIPPTGALWQVSKEGGTMPRWCCQGRELFYRASDGRLMAVPVGAGKDGTFAVTGEAKPLFAVRTIGNVQRFTYQPSLDGRQFLVSVPSASAARPITVVLNWPATTKR
jgi:Tol biopolymer transport system component